MFYYHINSNDLRGELPGARLQMPWGLVGYFALPGLSGLGWKIGALERQGCRGLALPCHDSHQ